MSHTQEPGQTETEQSGKPKSKRVLYPYGSASPERDDAITVLGVLKVATASQIMRLVRPHLTDNKPIRNALLDLSKHGLVVSEGNTAGPRGRIGTPGRAGPAAQKLWRLRAAGLDYADTVMEEGVDGGLARGVARGGAKHAMAVNETVTAFVRGGTL
ncbi:replication-relaxation family protein [Actinacidiphila reveromycinica]|uniref:replication-relaxation family protein n=1 Tax=Actinacidiphila reveromycinica TaxID=659352 RepID=UPI00192499D1|nr:replication-relaxation family protein [Streptomyces sp. SN-593]